MLDRNDAAKATEEPSSWLSSGWRAFDLRGKLVTAAKVGVSILLLWLALHSVDWPMVAARVTRIDARYGGMALALLALQLVLFALRWRLIAIISGTTMSVGQAVRYSFISTFFGQTLPSTIGGDAVRIYLLRRAGAGWVGASYSVIVDRVIGVLMLSVFVLVTLPWALSMLPQAAGRLSILAIAAGCLAGVLGFACYGAFDRAWTASWWLTRQIDGIANLAFRTIVRRPTNVDVLALSAIVHLLTVVAVWCLARSIAAPLSLGQSLVLIPPVLLIAVVPVSIAGWGVREASMMAAFSFAGLPATDGLLVSILLGVALLLLGIVGGVIWAVGTEPVEPAGAGRGPQ